MKKILILALSAVLALTLFAGCASGEPATEQPEAAEEVTPEVTEQPSEPPEETEAEETAAETDDAQPAVQWLSTYDGPDRKDDKFFGVTEKSGGGYIAVGTTENTDESVDALIASYDADGALEWEKKLVSSQFNVVTETEQGFLAVGSTSSQEAPFADTAEDSAKSEDSAGTAEEEAADTAAGDETAEEETPDTNAAAIMFDETGEIVWATSFGGTGYDTLTGHGWARTGTPVILEDGGFLIPGTTYSDDGEFEGKNLGGGEGFLAELGADGSLVSTQTFGSTGAECLFEVKQLDDGGFVVAGTTHPAVTEEDEHLPVDGMFEGLSDDWEEGNLFVSKLDAERNVEWTSMLHTFGTSWGVGLTVTDGGVVVAGDTFAEAAEGEETFLYLNKLDAEGNVVWTQQYGDEGRIFMASFEPDGKGNYILAGETHYDSIIDEGAEGIRGWFGLVDGEGNLLWERRYDGTDYEVLFHVSPASDGGYIAAGEQASEKGDWDGSLIKYAAYAA